MVVANADQLLTIINNILYVSNLEAGGLAAANVDFDLYRLTQRIVEVMKVGVPGCSGLVMVSPI